MRLLTLLSISALATSTLMAQELKSDLPTIYIDTNDGSGITSKDVYTDTHFQLLTPDGKKQEWTDVRVRGRGNSTWNLAKKPYKLKFREKVRLLGEDRAKAKKWNLLANHGDKTLVRNAVASFIGTFAGQDFTPGCQFADLMLNGKYVGTYQITDQVDIRKNRVNITEQPEVLEDNTDISGGYLLEMDGFADFSQGNAFQTSRGVRITVKSPDEDVIVKRQLAYITEHVQKFENALFADNWLDPTEGYHRYCDLTTLASWYVTTEFAGNSDGFWSINFYKELGDDKLYWGPIWDFDIAFNNSHRKGDQLTALMADDGHGYDWCFTWIDRIRQDPEFNRMVLNLWKELREADIEDATVNYIDKVAAIVDRSQQLNFERWQVLQTRVWDEQYLFSTYAEGVQYLKDYVRSRARVLDLAFAEQVDPDDQGGIEVPEAQVDDYYVTYSPSEARLRFLTLNEAVIGSFAIYSINGVEVLSGAIAPEVSVATLTPGVYILAWTDASGRTRTVKFAR